MNALRREALERAVQALEAVEAWQETPPWRWLRRYRLLSRAVRLREESRALRRLAGPAPVSCCWVRCPRGGER